MPKKDCTWLTHMLLNSQDMHQLQRRSLQCSWTSSLELSADGPQTAGLVMQPFIRQVAEDIFLWPVGSKHNANNPILLLAYQHTLATCSRSPLTDGQFLLKLLLNVVFVELRVCRLKVEFPVEFQRSGTRCRAHYAISGVAATGGNSTAGHSRTHAAAKHHATYSKSSTQTEWATQRDNNLSSISVPPTTTLSMTHPPSIADPQLSVPPPLQSTTTLTIVTNICRVQFNSGFNFSTSCRHAGPWQLQPKVTQIVCITTHQPDTISNPNPNPTTKQHIIVSKLVHVILCIDIYITAADMVADLQDTERPKRLQCWISWLQ